MISIRILEELAVFEHEGWTIKIVHCTLNGEESYEYKIDYGSKPETFSTDRYEHPLAAAAGANEYLNTYLLV